MSNSYDKSGKGAKSLTKSRHDKNPDFGTEDVLGKVRKGADLGDTISQNKKHDLKKQNEIFRQKLKELNDKVEKAIDRTYVKRMLASKKKQNVDVAHKIRVKDREIENAQKQIENYKKEIDGLNIKIDELSQVDTLMTRENKLKENKAAIVELKKVIHELEKQSKDNGNELEKLTDGNEYNYKIKSLIDEIRLWKEKLRHRNENAANKQAEILSALQMNDYERIERGEIKHDANSSENNKVKAKEIYESSLKAKMQAKDQYEATKVLIRNELRQEQKEIAEMEAKRDQLMTRLKELEQERRISTYKLREAGRILKHNQLKPINPSELTDSEAAKRSGKTSRSKLGHRGSTSNLHGVKNTSSKPLATNTSTKGLSKNSHTQSNQILIKKKKLMTKQNEDIDQDFEKNQVIDYDKFKKMQNKKDKSGKLGNLKAKGSKGTFETKTMLK